MNWPFVRRSRYENARLYGVNRAKEILDLTERNRLCESELSTKDKMLAELTSIKQDVGILRAMIDASQLRNADLNIENTKLKEVNTDLMFAKKDLKQKIRKLESENSKLTTTNKQLQALHKTIGFFINKAQEQLKK